MKIKRLILNAFLTFSVMFLITFATTTITDTYINISGLGNITKTATCIVSQDGSGDYNGSTGTAIQNCINTLNTTGGIVFIKKGMYSISVPIDIDYDNITIDSEKAILMGSGTMETSHMIDASNTNKTTIRNIILDANNTARRCLRVSGTDILLENIETKNTVTGYIWGGLVISTSTNVVVRNLYIHDHPEKTNDNVVFSRVDNLLVEGCTFKNIGKNVLFYGGNNHRIIGNYFDNATKVNIQGNNTVFDSNNLESTDIYVLPFDADGGSDNRTTENVVINGNNIVNGNIFLTNGTNTIKRVMVSNNMLTRVPISSSDNSGISVSYMNETNAIFLTSNQISGYGRSGILLSDSSYVQISNNYLKDNGNATLTYRGNIIDLQNSHNNTVIGNILEGVKITVPFQILIKLGNNKIVNNILRGTYTTALSLSGINNTLFGNIATVKINNYLSGELNVTDNLRVIGTNAGICVKDTIGSLVDDFCWWTDGNKVYLKDQTSGQALLQIDNDNLLEVFPIVATNINMNGYNITGGYIISSTTRPVSAEGICYWNNSENYHCLQCYNSTNWICGVDRT